MPLKIRDIMNIMEYVAPVELKESYDNVGLMIGNPDSEITSILITLDCTLKVIEEAKRKGCNLILSHHPLLFRKPQTITTETLQGKKIIELIKNDINVYSSHTNLDSVKDGINDTITRLLGYNEWQIIKPSYTNDKNIDSGLGRLVSLVKSICLKELCDNIKNSLKLSYLRYSGYENKTINKVAIINGSGEDFIEAAVKMGADCVITGDTSYHYVSDYTEQDVAVIDAGHFGTEWPAMNALGELLKNRISEMGFSCEILISQCNEDPYKYY